MINSYTLWGLHTSMEGNPRIDDTCFLCEPSQELVFAEDENSVALCGLGPLVEGYSVVATKSHVASAADAVRQNKGFLDFAKHIRLTLSNRFGNCILTEHGRLPVCLDVSGTTEAHCFHAHFLLFPGTSDILDDAQRHFARTTMFSSLDEALQSTIDGSEYMLVSPTESKAAILTRPGRLIRQFARLIVAESLGKPELASWRANEDRAGAVNSAKNLRPFFKQGSK
jgi:hypothetical protein